MWHVVYHRKPIDSHVQETLRFKSRFKFRAFLVYLSWRIGYTLKEYEIREIKFYESTTDNVILLDEFRRGK